MNSTVAIPKASNAATTQSIHSMPFFVSQGESGAFFRNGYNMVTSRGMDSPEMKSPGALKPAEARYNATGNAFPFVQPKLTINQPGDQYEQEADAMADHIMRYPAGETPHPQLYTPRVSALQRNCDHCEKEEQEKEQVQMKRKSNANEVQLSAGPGSTVSRKCAGCEEEEMQRKEHSNAPTAVNEHAAHYIGSLHGRGTALSKQETSFYGSSFGYDFSQVRVHTDSSANKSAADLNALAYTHGNNIVFGSGQYQPSSPQGKQLMAHELTHVVQQSGGKTDYTVQCDVIDDLRKAAEKKAEEIATAKLNALGAEPVGAPSGFKGEQPKCGPNFCQPFASKTAAIADLAWAGPLILAGIAKKVNTRVVPLWAAYLAGGSPVKDLTADFGADFTASPTTATTTDFLLAELTKDITANHVAIMGGAAATTVDFTPRLSSALSDIDNPAKPIPPQMNFGIPSDIAGNVAGGIGKDETSFPIGAQPSPFNDSRQATVKATLTRSVGGSILVVPSISFIVKDTIDLCPGDCGSTREMVATVPLSRFEATGLSGDVPLEVRFDAPAMKMLPFLVTPPVAPPVKVPVPGKVTASVLNIRSAPDTSASIVDSYKKGDAITVLCQTTGSVVDGNNVWFQTDKGFVSGRYITTTGGGIPAAC